MAEQEQGQSQAPDTSTTQPETLESVYKQYNVEAEAQSFNPTREQQVQPQAPQPAKAPETAVPDPVLDQEGFKKWASGQNQFLQQSLQSLTGELTQLRVERMKAKEEADINNAVKTFRGITGDDVDDDVAEIALGQRARKDPKFLSVYQNRGKNPQAWNAAVKALANEFKGKTSFKIDPQIAENQRAAKQSIQGSQSRQPDEPNGIEKNLASKTGNDFTRAWRNLVDGAGY